MPYKIAFVTYGTPWKSAAMKMWQHHDVIFKYLHKETPIEIHVVLPPRGGSHLIDTLKGSKAHLMTSIKDLPVFFYDELYMKDFDCLFLELAQNFSSVELPYAGGKAQFIIDGDDQNDHVLYLCERAMTENKPIVYYDPDLLGYSKEIHQPGTEYISTKVFNIISKYSKLSIISPMENHPDKRTKFVPFNIDPEDIRLDRIVPKSLRSYFTRYVGNNYFRSQFPKIFAESCDYGKVEVVGANWGSFIEKYPEINWRNKFALTLDRARSFFAECLVGLYGNPDELKKYKHHTLRIREYVISGTFIIPENVYYKDRICVDNLSLTTDDILRHNPLMDNLIDMNDDTYNKLVQTQIEKIMSFFDARKWINVYKEALGA